MVFLRFNGFLKNLIVYDSKFLFYIIIYIDWHDLLYCGTQVSKLF